MSSILIDRPATSAIPVVAALPPKPAMVMWVHPHAGEATISALSAYPEIPAEGSPVELVRAALDMESTTRPTISYADTPYHPDVLKGVAGLASSMSDVDLSKYRLVSANADPVAGYLYLDSAADRVVGQYRKVPVGELPTVEQARDRLVAALEAHGVTEPMDF